MVRYSVLRLLIFFGTLAALWLLGLRDRDEQLILLVLAAAISMVVSFFVLKPFREDYSRQIAERLERRAQAKQQARQQAPRAGTSDESAEDAEDERQQGQQGQQGQDGPVEYR
jgi:Flp pilus assembly protein TadB